MGLLTNHNTSATVKMSFHFVVISWWHHSWISSTDTTGSLSEWNSVLSLEWNTKRNIRKHCFLSVPDLSPYQRALTWRRWWWARLGGPWIRAVLHHQINDGLSFVVEPMFLLWRPLLKHLVYNPISHFLRIQKQNKSAQKGEKQITRVPKFSILFKPLPELMNLEMFQTPQGGIHASPTGFSASLHRNLDFSSSPLLGCSQKLEFVSLCQQPSSSHSHQLFCICSPTPFCWKSISSPSHHLNPTRNWNQSMNKTFKPFIHIMWVSEIFTNRKK